jgi:hypothetical protein
VFCWQFLLFSLVLKKGGEKAKKLLAGERETLTFALPNENAGIEKRVL